jgi:hypothetical protein
MGCPRRAPYLCVKLQELTSEGSNAMMIRLVAVTYLLMGSICNAAIIGTDPIPPASMLSGFGSSEVYRGETFRLSSGPAFANTLTVFVGPTSDLGANFRVLITEGLAKNNFPIRVYPVGKGEFIRLGRLKSPLQMRS